VKALWENIVQFGRKVPRFPAKSLAAFREKYCAFSASALKEFPASPRELNPETAGVK
jgi:hypothetical protein